MQARAGTEERISQWAKKRRKCYTYSMAILEFPRNSPRHAGPGRRTEIGGNDNMHVILERVKIDLDEDEIRRLIDAVGHYEAYLHSQQRDDEKFRELLVRLRKMLGKRS